MTVFINSIGISGSFTVTVGGVSVPQLGIVDYATGGGGDGYAIVFGLLNPPQGTQTVVATAPNSSYNTGDSISYKNVSSLGTVATTSGSTTSAAQSVSSGVNQMVAQAFTNYNPGSFSSYNQTQRYSGGGGTGAGGPLLLGDAFGASTVNFSATAPTSGFGGIALPLKP